MKDFTFGPLLATIAAALLLAIPLQAASPTPATTQVQAALDDLNTWLAVDDYGRGWQKFLRSDELAAQIALGAKADRQKVGEILALYAAGKSGTELPRFLAVRTALRSWVNELSYTPAVAPQVVRDAASKFVPIAPEKVAAAKAELQTAITELDQYLANGGAASAAGWKAHLQWDALTAQLARPEGMDPKVVDSILEKYRTNSNGLENAKFTRVRQALRDYSDLSSFAADPKGSERYAAAINQLATHLEGYAATHSTADLAGISHHLTLLHRMHQADSLIASVRTQFQQPNAYATVSERLLNAAMSEPVYRTTPVSDNILGTSIEGTATLSGKTTIVVRPSADQAQFDIILTGNIISESTGRNGPVTILSTSDTTVWANKLLCFTQDGLSEAAAKACASTNTCIHDICARCKLIEKIAWKKAAQSKSQAESIASGKAAARIEDQINSQSIQQVAEMNGQYQDKFRRPLIRRDLLPAALKFSSEVGQINVASTQVAGAQIGAPDAPPALPSWNDVSVRVHESSVTNVGESLLGGLTLTDERLEQIIRDELKTEVPEELKITPEKDPWSITFANEAPVRASFSGGLIKLSVRGRRFSRGDQAINDLIEIAATYKVEKTATGSKLVRQGEVEVNFVGREKLGAQQVAFRTFLRRKFDAMFKAEIVSDGLKLKGKLERAGKLQLAQVQSETGWLGLGWRLASNDSPTPAPVPEVAPAAPAPAAAAAPVPATVDPAAVVAAQ